MALLVDPKLPEPIEVNGRKYQMRPATVAERTRWRRAVAASGGRQHGPWALLNALAAGVRLLMKDSDAVTRDAVLAKIEAQKVRVATFFESAKAATGGATEANRVFLDAGIAMHEGDRDLANIVAIVTENYPAFAQMVADEAMYWPTCGMEALRMFCVGWEGIEAECVRGPTGMTDDALAEVPEGDLPEIGKEYQNLISVTPQQRKNLLSQRSSSSAVGTSSI